MIEKIAAIWARVSDPHQTSLPDQVNRAKTELESRGYIVPDDRILAASWTSLELFDCPEFLRLASWVKRHEINAIGMLDRDRLQSIPEQRLAFLAECREAGIEIILCQGPAMIEGDMGVLIEHVQAIAKKQQVLRAKLGAKDGLHDKVTEDRKPISRHKIFGYRWETDTRMVPNEDWETLKLILDLAYSGNTLYAIQRELKKRAILSPKGGDTWERSSILSILRNPVYGGRYYALRHLAVKPNTRKAKTFGNSSTKCLSLDKATWLPEVEVINPPLTWGQWLELYERRQRNWELSQRHARADYVLRGFIRCGTHRGKKGEPLKYYGQPQGKSYKYTCPKGGCDHPNLNGPRLLQEVKEAVKKVLNAEPDEFYGRLADKRNRVETAASLQNELQTLQIRYEKNINAETELENRNLLGQEHPEVYQRVKTRLHSQRKWIQERQEYVEGMLAQLGRDINVITSLNEIRAKFNGRLDELTDAEWRQLFTILNLEITTKGTPEAAPIPQDRPLKLSDFDLWDYVLLTDKVEATISFPLQPEMLANIVFIEPGGSAPSRILSPSQTITRMCQE